MTTTTTREKERTQEEEDNNNEQEDLTRVGCVGVRGKVERESQELDGTNWRCERGDGS